MAKKFTLKLSIEADSYGKLISALAKMICIIAENITVVVRSGLRSAHDDRGCVDTILETGYSYDLTIESNNQKETQDDQ